MTEPAAVRSFAAPRAVACAPADDAEARTLLLDGGNVTRATYYQDPITNHYARLVHEHLKDGRGYAFAYDDVNLDPTDAEARITGALRTYPSLDAVLALNSQVAATAVTAPKSAGSKAAIVTFDLNTDVTDAIKAGDVLFAVDQQQYEQGYLPVVLIKLYRDNANTVGGGKPVLTGPGIVDRSTVDRVAEYAERGTR